METDIRVEKKKERPVSPNRSKEHRGGSVREGVAESYDATTGGEDARGARNTNSHPFEWLWWLRSGISPDNLVTLPRVQGVTRNFTGHAVCKPFIKCDAN